MAATCIEKVNDDIRDRLCCNIRITGGNCAMRNFSQVMHTELHNIFLNKYKGSNVKINTNNCTISNWNGGNIIAGLGIFKDLLINKKEEENKDEEKKPEENNEKNEENKDNILDTEKEGEDKKSKKKKRKI